MTLHRLVPRKTAVIVVDIQERLAAAIPEEQRADVIRATTILVEGARLLRAPVLVTVQYSKGLGPTLGTFDGILDSAGATSFDKMHFSAMDSSRFDEALRALRVTDVVVVGLEAHVCVYQTVRDLSGAGVVVHVPIDGVGSRRDDHRRAGLALCERAGAVLTTAETVAFDWLRQAGTVEFKVMSKLIR